MNDEILARGTSHTGHVWRLVRVRGVPTFEVCDCIDPDDGWRAPNVAEYDGIAFDIYCQSRLTSPAPRPAT